MPLGGHSFPDPSWAHRDASVSLRLPEDVSAYPPFQTRCPQPVSSLWPVAPGREGPCWFPSSLYPSTCGQRQTATMTSAWNQKAQGPGV